MNHLYTEIINTLPANPLRRFFGLVSRERKTIMRIYLYAIIAGIIGLSLPLGIQAIINLVANGALTTSWFVLIAFVVGGMLAAGVLQILQLVLSESIQQRIFVKSALELSFRIPRLDAASLQGHYLPDLLNRFFDTVTVQKGLSKILLDFSAAALQILFGLILLAFYHPFFIIFGFGLLMILFLVIRVTGPMGLRTSLRESKYKYAVAHWLEEVGRKRDLFKGEMPGDASMEKTDGLTVSYLNARKGHFRILLSKYVVLLLFKVLIISGLLVIGSLLVIQNQLNLGQLVAAEIIIILIINSLDKLVASIETIYDVLTGLEKLGYITDMPLEPQVTELVKHDRDGSISLRDYTLQFPGTQAAELTGINLDIASGEVVRIAGGSEQTRNALVRSIAGDFHAHGGQLTVGGIPVRNWNRDELRAGIGLYSHPGNIMDGTILENVRLMAGPVSMSEVHDMAKVIGLDKDIEQMPEGWQENTGPDAIWLSESLRRKIVLCRLLLAKPKIYLMANLFSDPDDGVAHRFWTYLNKEQANATVILLNSSRGPELSCDREFKFIDNTIVSISK